MKQSLRTKLNTLFDRLEEVDLLLSLPNATDNMQEFAKLSRERNELAEVTDTYKQLQTAETDLQNSQRLLNDAQATNDAEMLELAELEIAELKEKIPQLDSQLEKLLLPKDPDDHKNVVLEIRAGTGGDESALFSGDLFRMYSRYAESKGWRVEILSSNESDLGGYKEIVAQISGENVYAALKFESGAHRVQRVPETETQGRVHTSACTVAILPEAEETEEININPADLRIDTYRASGAGGQHIQKTDSAVRITHLPTGITAECQDGRSQHSNKASAMKVLISRLLNIQKEKERSERADLRKSLVGSGDRSERIRTYNFPQGRLTDHRINLTLYKLTDILSGNLDEVINALATEFQAEQLANLND